MSEIPPIQDQPGDVDEIYRRASALDSSRPSDRVRSAVLAYAAQLAAERATGDGARTNSARATAYRKGWRPAVFGTLAAAALAGILTAPYLLTPRVPSGMARPSAEALRPRDASSAAPSAAPTQAPSAAPTQAPSAAPTQAPSAAPAQAPSAAPAQAPSAAPAQAPSAAPSATPAPTPSAAPSRTPRQAPAAPRAFATDEAPKLLDSPSRAEITPAPQRKALAQHNADSGRERAASEGQPTSPSEGHVGAQSTVTVEAQRRPHTQAPSAIAALRSDPTPAPPTPDIPSDPAADLAVALWKAADAGDLPGLQASLDAQVDIEARDATGRTALMIATLNGRTDAVQLLLARGANPNAADALGTTPLQAAAAGHQRAIIKALKHAGALE